MADRNDKADGKTDGDKSKAGKAGKAEALEAGDKPVNDAALTVKVRNNHHQGLRFELREGPSNPGPRILFSEQFGQEQLVTEEQAALLCAMTYTVRDRESGRTTTRQRFKRV